VILVKFDAVVQEKCPKLYDKHSAVAETGDRFSKIDTGRKLGVGFCVPDRWGGTWFPSNTMSPGPRHTSVPSGILICTCAATNKQTCESVNNIDALYSKGCRCNFAMKQKAVHIACKRDPVVRDRDETETFDFQSETRSRPRPSHISTRLR